GRKSLPGKRISRTSLLHDEGAGLLQGPGASRSPVIRGDTGYIRRLIRPASSEVETHRRLSVTDEEGVRTKPTKPASVGLVAPSVGVPTPCAGGDSVDFVSASVGSGTPTSPPTRLRSANRLSLIARQRLLEVELAVALVTTGVDLAPVDCIL